MKIAGWSASLKLCLHVNLLNKLPHEYLALTLTHLNVFLLNSLSGSDSVGRRDSVCFAASHFPSRFQTFGEIQDRPHPLHDGVVYVCLLQNPAVGVSSACVGHVPL